MLKPETIHSYLQHQEERLGHSFSLLCWNVQKSTLNEAFSIYLHELNQRFDLDLLMLQEAKVHLHTKLDLKAYSYVLAPNIQTKKALFGVLTASKSHYHHHHTYITHAQEMLLATHKSVLTTHHLLANETVLVAVNIHAINFMPNLYFQKELDQLFRSLKEHKGPLLIAGDFNSWNKKRMRYLEDFSKKLHLSFVDFDDEHHIKSLIKYKLDHILYRGLELESAKALNSGRLSDHNPLYVQFKLKDHA
jgi:endonuclease/exonuclease/phosphatase (EEP) superfamily protein YafD